MTEVAIVQTDLAGREAGEALGRQIREQLSGTPDALIVFAAPDTDHAALLEALAAATGTRTIVGCSSAGEFTSDGSGQGLTNVTAIRAADIRFAAAVGTGLAHDQRGAARAIAADFRGTALQEFPYRAALVLVDALAGHAEELVDALTLATGGSYRFFGGGRRRRRAVPAHARVLRHARPHRRRGRARDRLPQARRHRRAPRLDAGEPAAARHPVGRLTRREPERGAGGRGVRGARRGHHAAVRPRRPAAVLPAQHRRASRRRAATSCACRSASRRTAASCARRRCRPARRRTSCPPAARRPRTAAAAATRDAMEQVTRDGRDAEGGALLRLRRDATAPRPARSRRARGGARRARGRAVRRVQLVRADRARGGAVQRLPQLHGRRLRAPGVTGTRRPVSALLGHVVALAHSEDRAARRGRPGDVCSGASS